MLSRALQHLRRYVVVYVVLFVALSGTSYAATAKLVRKNSVGSAQVINGSLQKVDLSKKAAAALRGTTGPQGPQWRGRADRARGAAGAERRQRRHRSHRTGRWTGATGPTRHRDRPPGAGRERAHDAR